MLGKVQIALFFQWFVAPDVRKVGSLKAAGAEVAVHAEKWKMARRCGAKHICKSKCTKHIKNTTFPEQFLKFRFGKWHALCDAKQICKTKCTKHHRLGAIFEFQIRCRKITRRCGAKHICKSKCTKHHMLWPLFELPMSKNRTPLWREAHL